MLEFAVEGGSGCKIHSSCGQFMVREEEEISHEKNFQSFRLLHMQIQRRSTSRL